MSEQNQPKSMMIVSQDYMDQPTFGMIPVTNDCPFVEVVFLPNTQQLAVMSKTTKETFHFFSRLDDNGDPIPAKRRVETRAPYKQERKLINTFYEYYLKDAKDIRQFLDLFAINPDSNLVDTFMKK
ncbi:MAG: hypothetical protein RIR01_2275 [Bacteroidota bacterium]|jgi:hypothetical protein